MSGWQGMHVHISPPKNAHIPHALFLLNRREPENKRRPSRQRELGSQICFPFSAGKWETKRMHAHVNSPSASAGKLEKKTKIKVEKPKGKSVLGKGLR